MQSIYLDAGAATPILEEVLEAMRPHFRAANAASSHHAGRQARQALEEAREKTAALLQAHPDEVIFTSGATEANNLALFGLAGETPGHILASPIEHPCVVEPLNQLAARGFEVEFLPVGGDGMIEQRSIMSRLRPTTRLVTAQLVNH